MFLAYSLKVELRKTNSYVINRSGYAVNHFHKSVLRRLRNTWPLPSGECHAFFWTHIYPHERSSALVSKYLGYSFFCKIVCQHFLYLCLNKVNTSLVSMT